MPLVHRYGSALVAEAERSRLFELGVSGNVLENSRFTTGGVLNVLSQLNLIQAVTRNSHVGIVLMRRILYLFRVSNVVLTLCTGLRSSDFDASFSVDKEISS